MENFKGYVYTIFSGLLLLAAVIFWALQWSIYGDLSIYGKTINQVPMIWVVLFSAIGGVVAFWLVRVLIKGVRILRKVRKAQRKAVPAKPAPKPAAPAQPQKAASDDGADNPLSPR